MFSSPEILDRHIEIDLDTISLDKCSLDQNLEHQLLGSWWQTTAMMETISSCLTVRDPVWLTIPDVINPA